jgi:hypothetical protein
MPATQKYFHDKFILLLASSNVFLAFLCTVLIVLRTGVGQGSSDYIIQYRANLGIGAFKSGSLTDILGFVVFALLVAGLTILLSVKAYRIHRALAVVILSLGLFLMLLAVIVSNSLLGLR